MKLIMTVGIPGSGKSTWVSNELKNNGKAILRVCPDVLRELYGSSINDQSVNGKVWAVAEQDAATGLITGLDVILDATNCKSHDRVRFITVVKKQVTEKTGQNIQTCAVVFPLDVNACKKRIAEDLQKGVVRSNVPSDVIDRMAESYKGGLEKLAEQFDEVIYI